MKSRKYGHTRQGRKPARYPQASRCCACNLQDGSDGNGIFYLMRSHNREGTIIEVVQDMPVRSMSLVDQVKTGSSDIDKLPPSCISNHAHSRCRQSGCSPSASRPDLDATAVARLLPSLSYIRQPFIPKLSDRMISAWVVSQPCQDPAVCTTNLPSGAWLTA